MQFYVFQFQSVNAPECLIGIVYLDVFKLQILHLPEEFRPVDYTVFHHHIVAIPDGRTTAFGEITTCNETVIYMPPWIFSVEFAVVTLYIAAAFYTRLAIGYRYIVKTYVVCAEERTLSSERQIVY